MEKRIIKYFAFKFLATTCLIMLQIALSLPMMGQPYLSKLGRFQVDNIRGCAPLTVNLTNNLTGDCTVQKPCVMEYLNSGSPMQNQFTFTYDQVGTYILLVLYQSIGYDSITITVDKNILPNYEIYSCNSNKVVINVTDRSYDKYVIDFGDGTPPSTVDDSNSIQTPPHNYLIVSNFLIGVRGINLNAKDNCSIRTQNFTTYSTLPEPKINELVSVDKKNINLNLTTSSHINYSLEEAVDQSSVFKSIRKVYGDVSIAVDSLNLANSYYCYRLNAFDPCINLDTYSNVVCSSILSVTVQNNMNQINWSTGNLSQVSNYSILKNSSKIELQSTISSYEDKQVECKSSYCYQITTYYQNNSESLSLEKCVDSYSTIVPNVIDNISTSVSQQIVALNWLEPSNTKSDNYTISRSSKGMAMKFLTNATSTEYEDNFYNSSENFCYQMYSTSECDIASENGIVACPIVLVGDMNLNKFVDLEWTPYLGWNNGVLNYSVVKYSNDGRQINSVNVNTTNWTDDIIDTENQQVFYQIIAYPNQKGVDFSKSNQVEIVRKPIIYGPTAFSPNNDYINDTFIISGIYVSKLKMKIFDRWGNIIYTTDNNVPWNGLRDGKVFPPSTYIWKAEFIDMLGNKLIREGTVSLLNN